MIEIMRIRAVTHERVSIPLREVFRTAIRETDRVDALAVAVSVDDGETARDFIGYATATPMITGDTLESMEAYLDTIAGPLLAGRTVANVWELRSELLPLAVHSPSGTAGLDLALAALEEKGEPSPVRVQCSVTVSAASVEDMVTAASKRIAQGFSVVKCKLGVDPDRDLGRFLAIDALRCETAPHVELWVDANQGWSVDESMRFLDGLPHGALGRLEQPTPAGDFEALAKVRALTDIPIVADESVKSVVDVERIAALGAADIVNVKLMKHGGLLATQQVIDAARVRGLGVLVGSMMEHPSSVAMAVRLAAAQAESVHDLDAGWWAADTAPSEGRRAETKLAYVDGWVTLISGNGAGDPE